MPVEIKVPELGESVIEATVGRWLKKEGDHVKVGEAVVEIETDKVNLEVGAEREGTLARIARQEGEDVKVGDVLGVIEETAAQSRASQTAAAIKPAEPAPASRAEVAAPAVAAPAEPAVAGPKAQAAEERVTPVARRMAE